MSYYSQLVYSEGGEDRSIPIQADLPLAATSGVVSGLDPHLGGSLANPEGTACGSISPAFLRAIMLPVLCWKLFSPNFFFMVFTALYDIIFQ
jgi:hypothetical protein